MVNNREFRVNRAEDIDNKDINLRAVHSPPAKKFRLCWKPREMAAAMAALVVVPVLLLGLVRPAAAIETLDMLRAIQSGASTTNDSPGVFNTALCVANNSTDTRDFLVVASFTQGTTGGPNVSATVDYRLAETDGTTTYSATGQRFLEGGSDRGNGMLAWIFDSVSGSGDCTAGTGTRFLLEHADDNASRTVSTDRITLLAIPLDTEPNNVSLDWARATQGDVTTFSTTSTTFEPVTGMAAEVTIDNANAPRGAYVVATLSSEATEIGADGFAVGEWTLQGSADSTNGIDGTWVDIGSQIERSMSSTNETGMVQLTAIVEGLDAGTYYFRLATLTSDTAEDVVTTRAQLAAVSLVYAEQGGGYFPWFNDTYTSGECDATGNNSPESLDGVIASNIAASTFCDEVNPDPLADAFTMDRASDVFMTFVLNANTTQSGSGDVGSFENEIWNGLPTASGTPVFGNDQNGESNEVQRVFSDNATDRGAMGQVALWDSGDTGNAAGSYNAYGGWSISGNALETFEATMVGWVGASAAATRAFVTKFDAVSRGGQILVEWGTVAERGTMGFRLFRLDESSGTWSEVTSDLVPGMMDARRGGSYAVPDPAAELGGTYTYVLEEEDVRTGRRRYGPYTVTVLDGGAAAAAPLQGRGAGYLRAARPLKLRKAKRNSKALRARPRQAVPLDQARFRVLVDRPGIQYVSAADLAALTGVPQKKIEHRIRKGRFRLTHQGAEVAWLPFDMGSGLVFYATGLKTRYTNQDVFWLEPGKGTRMASRGGRKPPARTVPGVFTDTIRYDPDEFAATAWVSDPAHDFWFWHFLFGDIDGFGTAALSLDAPGAEDAGGDVSLKLYLYGLSDEAPGDDHHVAVEITGDEEFGGCYDDSLWDGLGPQTATLRFPQGCTLFDGDNKLVLRALLDTGAARSWAYLDAVELTYSRRYEALDDALLLRGDANEYVTATGFSGRSVVVLDVSDPNLPLRLRAVRKVKTGGGYAVTFRPESPDTPYLLAVRSAFALPEVAVRGAAPDLVDGTDGYDYLVLAPAELMEAARTLANHRAGQGLSALALDVQHVYDDFNGGVADASAIVDFLRHAYDEWGTTPSYLTLMGRGTRDPRDDILGLGDNRIPTTWLRTPLGLSPSDAPYADLVGGDNGAWEIATSRLPVVDADEAAAVVAKIIAYEAAPPLYQILLSADNNPEGIADFSTFSDKLAAGFGDAYLVNKVHMEDPLTAASDSQDLKNYLQQGALFWHWAGHGAPDRFATEPLFQSTEVADLANGTGLPVLTSTTCMINQFDLPGDPSIAERLVVHADGGILASFSPASISITGQGAILSFAFRDALLADGPVRLGDAAKRAVAEYAQRGFLDYVGTGFVLLGDAASLINK